MATESNEPSKAPARRAWSFAQRLVVLAVVAVIVTASSVAAGWVLIRQDLGLVFTAHTDKDNYLPGEKVRVWVEYTNYGFESILLTFNTSGKAQFLVFTSDGEFVCDIGFYVLMAITKVTVKPGESTSFGVDWDQTIENQQSGEGEQAPYPASYYVVALTASNEYDAIAKSQQFTISGVTEQ